MQNSNRANSQTMRAAIALRHRILDGNYSGGSRIYEAEIAGDLGISRTPVRAAMSWLAEEGLIERGESGGFVVRTFAYEDFADTIQLRGILEGTAARFAAERGLSDRQARDAEALMAKLDRCVAALPENLDFDDYSALNMKFHDMLAQMSGSSVIATELERIKRLPFASPSAFLPQDRRPSEFAEGLRAAQAQHREILASIKAREGTRAEAITREHARTALANLRRLTKSTEAESVGVTALALLRQDAGAA
ncbi:FCD domain-containing protein [Rhodobacterales bacterium HKCCE4037]|nr:FCD domain-containing protein [Rhodobacterales bacterium HKCCE4037]